MSNYSPSYLYHHGILGQKWGRRNGPPYPLGESDHSASERRAGWRKSLDKDKRNNKKDGGTDRYSLTDNQKRALKIGTAAVGTALAAYGGYKLYQSGILDNNINIGKNIVTDTFMKQHKLVGNVDSVEETFSDVAGKSASRLKRLASKETLSESLAKANPLRSTLEGQNNCTNCAVAGFLRMAGYDVTAKGTGGNQQLLGGLIEDCFKGARVLDGSAVKFGKSPEDAAEFLINKFGQNASGVCSIQWDHKIRPGGHAFNWDIKDGKVSFYDFQAGEKDNGVMIYWKMMNPRDFFTVARLDGAEINIDALEKYVNFA